MFLKKSEEPHEIVADEPIAGLVEPKSGYSDEDVVEKLEKEGAQGVEVLARGFISARAIPSVWESVVPIAHVHAKALKHPIGTDTDQHGSDGPVLAPRDPRFVSE